MALPWGIAVSLLPRGQVSLRTAVLAGALARVLLVGSPPLLSDDLYRFLFEGVALQAGHNPFVEAPAVIGQLNPWLADRVNHPDIPSIYPPVAQWWFRLMAVLGPRPAVAQALTSLIDIANIALLHRLCRARGMATWPTLVYALHPLTVIESANGAHLEPLALLFCFSAALALTRSTRGAGWIAAVAATLGVGVKLLPVLFAPAVARRLGWRQAVPAAFSCLLLLIALAIPVLSAGPALLDALGTYSRSWSFNGLVFPLFEPILGSWTRYLLAIAGLLVAAHAATLDDPVRTWRQVAAAFVMLSPTVHPWYVLWVFAPALVLGGRGWPVAAAFLQGSYLVLLYDWNAPPWLGPATWGPALTVLATAAFIRVPSSGPP